MYINSYVEGQVGILFLLYQELLLHNFTLTHTGASYDKK
jgi:hypothetical protein